MKTKKNKYIAIAIFVYTITYFFLLETSSDAQDLETRHSKPIERFDFSKVVINANSYTIIEENTPYKLQNGNTVIKPIFVLKTIEGEYEEKSKYFVQIPNNELVKINLKKIYNLYDIDMKIEVKKNIIKEVNYEIAY